MKKINNLNEEINRIKSLFTEERMFGNLVEEKEVITENNIKKGSEGEEVVALQQLLGINPADGKFGPQTDTEVKKFQKENGLSADGIVGPKTLQKIVDVYDSVGSETSDDESTEETKSNDVEVNEWIVLSDKELFNEETVPNPTLKGVKNLISKISNKIGFKPEFKGGNTQQKSDKTQQKTDNSGDETTNDQKSSGPRTEKGVRGVPQKRGGTGTESKGKSIDQDTFSKSKIGIDSKRGGIDVLGMKLDRVDIINNKATCKDHINKMMKLSKNGKSREEIEAETDGKEYIERIEWCLSNFYNVFEKDGVFKRGSRILTMLDTWNIPVPEKVSGGLEGEKYTVKLDDGQKIAIIKKTKQNKYRFRSALNVPLIDKSSGRPMFNQDNYEQAFYDALNIDKNKKKIVIQRAFEKKKIDMGTFVIADR